MEKENKLKYPIPLGSRTDITPEQLRALLKKVMTKLREEKKKKE